MFFNAFISVVFLLQNYGVFIITALFCGSFIVAPQFNVNVLPHV